MSGELILVGIWSLGALLLIFQHKLLAYTLLFAPFILLPVAFLIAVVEKSLGFSLVISIFLAIIFLFTVFSFFLEYPYDLDLHNEDYLEEISFLEAEHARKEISKTRKVLNRAFYSAEFIFYNLKYFIGLYLREYGSGRVSAYADSIVTKRYDITVHGDLEENLEGVVKLLEQVKSADLPELNRTAYILISVIITWIAGSEKLLIKVIGIYSYPQNHLAHSLYVLFYNYKIPNAVLTMLLLTLLYYLLRYFRMYADGANTRFQHLRQYIDYFQKIDRFIVFAWEQCETDPQFVRIVADTLEMEYLSKIKHMNLIIHDDIVYVAINPNLSRSAFYSDIADLVESSAKFQKRISVLKGDEVD